MNKLAEHPRAVFVGQGLGVAGTTMTDTLASVPRDKMIDFPIAEELQLGFCIGLALDGWLPVCIYPRWNFVLRAADQLVNHLDRLPLYSGGGYVPKVIIRVSVPSVRPFDPGPQHDDDFSLAFSHMLRTVKMREMLSESHVWSAYDAAPKAKYSSIMVEYAALCNAVPSGVKAA